jgi:Leucine-rich repeat (LRR) protein
MSELSV